MAEDDSDGNGSLIVGMIILGSAVCVMIYCGIRQMLEDLPRYIIRDRTPEQISYMRENSGTKVRIPASAWIGSDHHFGNGYPEQFVAPRLVNARGPMEDQILYKGKSIAMILLEDG
ncbi:hypothetical protein BDV27DRAFT_152605 [Aspergillus caelatus]|uniref:Uncharacterized protein n=1 Tax=Aspergillus caelatus TaxID=61420 RepID=A0A5N7AJ87_9EURO|nr:uncharacterized protein BDV27DRAFT_152605 [Aspergillus caelatus]KAE8369947.1 hypothetical protein BDV27DRAFT_152605 [Aspergillus caelatus]